MIIIMIWYYKLLALHPNWVVFGVLILSSVCIFVSVTFKELPDFTDPALGFETRGTDISNRLAAWNNLLDETKPSGHLTSNLYERTSVQHFSPVYMKAFNTTKHKPIKNIDHKHKKHKKHEHGKNGNNISPTDLNNVIESNAKHLDDKSDLTDRPHKKGKDHHKNKHKRKHKKVYQGEDGFFCDEPHREYAHMILQRTDGNKSVLEMQALRAICDLELKLTQFKSYTDICQVEFYSQKCCRPWSLPNYIALLSNKTSCAEIEENDLLHTKELLKDCFKYYQSGALQIECNKQNCLAPPKCLQFNATFNIMHYLADNQFNTTNELISSVLFLPIAKSTKILPYFYEMSSIKDDGILTIAAMDLGLKNALFDDLIIHDGWLIGLGAVSILYCILIYTNSILITISTIIANVLSVGVAYFIYQVVIQLPYFPFVNQLAVVIIVGIGADDCFVYMTEWRLSADQWDASKKHLPRQNKLIFLVTHTTKRAAKAILVTSLTTAHAFLASYSSSITAIRCFGIFAAIVIMVNYVLMITWLPAMIVIVEGMNMRSCKCWQYYVDLANVLIDRFGNSMQNVVIRLVDKFKYIFIPLFLFIGVASGVIVLYYPKLGLPNSQTFQLLNDDHPFELYDTTYKHMFPFEISFTETDTFKLPMRFVWGIEAADDGNHLIPSSKGALHYDYNMNISSIEAQKWMLEFCTQIKQQDFFKYSNVSAILPSCFIENLIPYMKKRCFDSMTNTSSYPCCEDHQFPYEPEVFEQCLPDMISSLYKSPRFIFIPGAAGPKFERLKPNELNKTIVDSSLGSLVRAVVIEYETTQPFSVSYTEMANFTAAIENWFSEMLKTAPNALQNGWFSSELGFYDLQQNLSSGTLMSAIIAMISSLVALLLFTRNILVSLYAVLTVILIILSTLAVLVAMNWKLNILESIAVNTAVGLGIDFVLHYALNYQMSEKKDRQSATKYTLQHMSGPTLMAAFTTALAGGFMLFSNVLAYIQIGLFLLIVMTVSWVYATFFFTSLLWAIGPQNRTNEQQCDDHAMEQLNNKCSTEIDAQSDTN